VEEDTTQELCILPYNVHIFTCSAKIEHRLSGGADTDGSALESAVRAD